MIAEGGAAWRGVPRTDCVFVLLRSFVILATVVEVVAVAV